MTLFDSHAYLLHHERARPTFHSHSFLFDYVGNDLMSRLQDLKKTFHVALNLSPHPLNYPAQHYSELTLEKESFDLIVSCLQAHWVNGVPAFLKNIYMALQPEGCFLGALWGGNTLCELRESLMQAELSLTGGVSPRIAPMMHPADAPTLLGKAGFFMPVVDTDSITVSYSSLFNLMRDLRGMGETNKLCDRPKTFTRRELFKKAEEIYVKNFSDGNNKLIATFEVIFLTGWKYGPPVDRGPSLQHQ
jgi:SAM-dependent methyltransferase